MGLKINRKSIQVKVSALLGMVLVGVFAASTIVNVAQTSSALQGAKDSSEKSMKQIENAGVERARNVFKTLETGTKGSLERGEMKVFEGLLKDSEEIPGVKEVGLTNPEGQIIYSNMKSKLGSHLSESEYEKTMGNDHKTAEEQKGSMIYLGRSHAMEPDCIRCHTDDKVGDDSGVLFIRYDMGDVAAAKNEVMHSLDEAKRKSVWTGIVAGIIGPLVACIIVFLVLGRLIRRPLERLKGMMAEIRKGHLGDRLDMKQEDEIGETARAMDELAESLENELVAPLQQLAAGDLSFEALPVDDRDVVRSALKKVGEDLNVIVYNVQEASKQVALGANQISDSAQTLSQGATEQASALEEISSTLNELTSKTKENAESATQADILSNQARVSAEQGSKQATMMVSAMAELGDVGQSISKIIKVIDEIAFQTNLLALNAAVEAARAGQHGKGFAVVAEEVRNLAGRSAEAAKETTQMIEDVVKKTGLSAEMANQTEEALKEIEDAVLQASELVSSITESSNESAHSIIQINEGVEQVSQITQRNTANTEESAAASEELSGQSQELKGMLSNFTLKEDE